MIRLSVAFACLLVSFAATFACATRKDVDGLAAKNASLEKALEAAHVDFVALRADLDATRARLDNALRANAEASSDVMSDRARMQALGGRVDEASHAIDDIKKELASTRGEIDARLDELKRSQDVQVAKPAPVVIPPDKSQHYAATEAAYAKGDYNLARTLGRDFVAKYPQDDKADDILYLMADASLKEGRPSSALGEYNRILKQFPKSNTLGQTLFGMGEAYMMLHDCTNAKLAFGACESRFPKEAVGKEARARVAKLGNPAPGMCAPP
jgi:TolA-binding protein